MISSILAKDIMQKNVLTVKPDDKLDTVIVKLLEHPISGLTVVDNDNNLVGVISEKDVINFAFSGNLLQTFVKEAMSPKVTSCDVTTPIEQICMIITHTNFRLIPVTDKGKLAGVISRKDIIKQLYSYYTNE